MQRSENAMSSSLTFFNPNLETGPQYLENIATAYWYSDTLFTAVELEVFTHLESGGKTAAELALDLDVSPPGLERFLKALCTLGLLTCDDTHYFNTEIAGEYLVAGKINYQGDSILWRKYLCSGWQDLASCLKAGGRVNYGPPEEDPGQITQRIRKYITAMDNVAKTKVQEILPFFSEQTLNGEILDVGTGSGAMAAGFLARFPNLTATLLDLPQVLDYTTELMEKREFRERLTYCQANILEPWPLGKERFDLVILSNIVHVYSEEEIHVILERATKFLKPEGFLLIHDFFFEHYPEKAALFDLNMFINTYNGKTFSQAWVREQLTRFQLHPTGLIPLASDTGVIFAAKNKKNLAKLRLAPKPAS